MFANLKIILENCSLKQSPHKLLNRAKMWSSNNATEMKMTGKRTKQVILVMNIFTDNDKLLLTSLPSKFCITFTFFYHFIKILRLGLDKAWNEISEVVPPTIFLRSDLHKLDLIPFAWTCFHKNFVSAAYSKMSNSPYPQHFLLNTWLAFIYILNKLLCYVAVDQKL